MKVPLIEFTIFLVLSFFTSVSGQEQLEKLVILGAGPAGLTSAIYAGQAKLNPLVVEGDECEGQLTAVYRMENFPGFPEGIKGGRTSVTHACAGGKFWRPFSSRQSH